MGLRHSKLILPREKLKEYELLTHLNEKQILRAYEKFCKLNPDIDVESDNPAISYEKLDKVPEFQVNPFKDRLIALFADPLSSCLTFENYLNMMSVFCDKAPLNLKVEYAFKIYDFDGDDLISKNDMEEILNRLKVTEYNLLEISDVEDILNKAMADCDIDEDGYLTYTEFSYLMERLADFTSTFVIRI